MKVYQQCWKERAGWYAQECEPINVISAPQLADFLVNLFRGWHTTGIYHSAISAFFNLIIITKLPIIQSSIN